MWGIGKISILNPFPSTRDLSRYTLESTNVNIFYTTHWKNEHLTNTNFPKNMKCFFQFQFKGEVWDGPVYDSPIRIPGIHKMKLVKYLRHLSDDYLRGCFPDNIQSFEPPCEGTSKISYYAYEHKSIYISCTFNFLFIDKREVRMGIDISLLYFDTFHCFVFFFEQFLGNGGVEWKVFPKKMGKFRWSHPIHDWCTKRFRRCIQKCKYEFEKNFFPKK